MEQKHYDLPELIKRWEREQITTEQAVGQILLWLEFLVKRVARLEANQQKLIKSNEHRPV
ncbi:MAG: hypothetical protein JW953_22790 [Anaerolineae bacterium]|nr:hypothetical protein [Anaerolineae bacterium]